MKRVHILAVILMGLIGTVSYYLGILSEKDTPLNRCLKRCSEEAAREFSLAFPSQYSTLGANEQACRTACVGGAPAATKAASPPPMKAKASRM